MIHNFKQSCTPTHKRLLRFSKFANIFAWIIFAIYLLQTIGLSIDFAGLFGSHILLPIDAGNAVSYALNTFGYFVRGVIYWFLLKGVSLGLKILVQTDLNYRVKSQAVNNEQ